MKIFKKSTNIDVYKIEFNYINILFSTIIICLTILGFYFTYLISSFLGLFFISILFSLSIYRFVEFFNVKLKINYAFSILLVYFIFILIFTSLLYAILPIIINQSVSIFNMIYDQLNVLQLGINSGTIKIPTYISANIDIPFILTKIQENIGSISNIAATSISNIISWSFWFIAWIWGILLNIMIVFIVSFFMLLEKKSIIRYIELFLNKKQETFFSIKRKTISLKLSSWFSGMIVLSIFMWIFTYILLWILELFWISIEYKFSIAFVSGIAEFIPIIWPFMTFALMLVIAITLSYKAIIAVVIVYAILQFVEWNIMVPKIMKKVAWVSSLVVISVMSIGWILFWVPWVILSIPIAIIIDDFLDILKDKE